jgi:hypothetical protein
LIVAFPQHVREACAEKRNVDRGLTLASSAAMDVLLFLFIRKEQARLFTYVNQ